MAIPKADEVDGSRLRHLSAKLRCCQANPSKGAIHMKITTIGLDLAKHVFQVHAVDAAGVVVIRKALRRAQVLPFFLFNRGNAEILFPRLSPKADRPCNALHPIAYPAYYLKYRI
jgi:hypothetical protein